MRADGRDQTSFWGVYARRLGRAKIRTATEALPIKAYIIELVEAHWAEMEKKGVLPKGK